MCWPDRLPPHSFSLYNEMDASLIGYQVHRPNPLWQNVRSPGALTNASPRSVLPRFVFDILYSIWAFLSSRMSCSAHFSADCILRYRLATDAELNGHDAVPAATLFCKILCRERLFTWAAHDGYLPWQTSWMALFCRFCHEIMRDGGSCQGHRGIIFCNRPLTPLDDRWSPHQWPLGSAECSRR